ncbi:MAG TPA: alpha/beta fold hydrolase [Caulobacteraceae bacterium]
MQERIRYARSADGVRIAWTTCGTGPQTLVLGANQVTDIRRDWESPLVRPALQRLAERFRVIRYDQRGCGSSQRNVDRHGQDAWGEDLTAVIDTAGLDQPFVLLAYSAATPYAAVFAARHAARLSHLVVHGAYSCGAVTSGIRSEIIRNQAMVDIVETGWDAPFPASRMLVAHHVVLDLTAEEAAWCDKHSPLAGSAQDVARLMTANMHCDARPHMSQITTPTLVIQAEEDTCIQPAWGRAYAAEIPNAQYVEIPGKNHMPLARDPGFEPFMSHLMDFVGAAPARGADLGRLSSREREMLDGVCQGLSNEAIALRNDISVKTVRNHLTRVFDKLGVMSRTQAALTAQGAHLAADP